MGPLILYMNQMDQFGLTADFVYGYEILYAHLSLT